MFIVTHEETTSFDTAVVPWLKNNIKNYNYSAVTDMKAFL